ncbi:MAG: hypothetical protein II820_06075 [Ruminiclostridium sp.]|nr:hypothetical protein [Ruminiclostridium sp.]
MVRIDDLHEISLLNKAILAAKYSGLPENDELASDPTLAGLANRVYDEMSKHQDKKVLDEAALEELRRIKTSQGWRGQWRTAVMAARRDIMLKNASQEDRISIAKCYLSPFSCKEGELRAFLDDVDGKTGEHDLEKLLKNNSFTGARLLGCEYSFEKKFAHLVFMLSDRRVCDLYFSGVRRFTEEYGKAENSDIPEMPLLKKYSYSTGKTSDLNAEFAAEHGKFTISVSALAVDYWL